MDEQSPAVVYEFCGSIIDIGGQQFVFNTQTSNYSLPGKIKREDAETYGTCGITLWGCQ